MTTAAAVHASDDVVALPQRHPGRWVAAIMYPDAKVKETFSASEAAQEAPKVKFN